MDSKPTGGVCVINLPIIFFLIKKMRHVLKIKFGTFKKKKLTFQLNFFFLGYITHCSCCWAFQIYVSFQQIPTNPAGLIEYRAHPFWIQKYCPFHEHDNTPRCCSCERMEVGD